MKLTKGGGAWATHAALVLVQIAFASQAVEAKIAMLDKARGGEGIFPESLAMMRMLGGAIVFQSTSALVNRRSPGISRVDHARMIGLAIVGISLNQALFLGGLRWTTPFAVSILGATIPIFAAALAVVFRKDSLSGRTVLGLALAIGGVLSLTGIGSLDRGALLVALNSFSYAAYVVLSRDVVVRVGALRFMAWVFTWGALSFLPLGLGPMLGQIGSFSARGWLLVAYILAMPTIAAYLLNAWALSRSSATLVTVYIYLQPLIAGVLARVQLGHAISARAGVAAVLILAGLTVVATRRPPGRPLSSSPRPG